MRRLLIVWNTVVLLVLFGILGGIARGIVRAGMYAGVDRELALRLERFIARPPRPDTDERPGRGGGGGGRGNPFKPHRYDRTGRSVVPPGHYPLWDEAAFLACQTQGTQTTTIQRDGEPLRVRSVPIYEGRRLVGVAQMPYPVTEVERAVTLLDRALLALVPLVLLAAWGGAALLTRRVLQPVQQLTATAARLEAHHLSERLPTRGTDEFAALATTFNGMLGRLQTAFEQQRRFVADASHELKTPLTRIKGIASMTLLGPATPERLRGALEEIDRSADGMGQLVQDLLLLARSDAGNLLGTTEMIALPELLEQAQQQVARPDAAPVEIECDAATLRGNRGLLLRLLVNLLDNALRHTPPDGQVRLIARPGQVIVADTGCGIAPEHLARLGERFYRVDSARSRHDGGTGLGLAICRSIVAAHDGALTITSVPGQGTTVTVTLPSSDA